MAVIAGWFTSGGFGRGLFLWPEWSLALVEQAYGDNMIESLPWDAKCHEIEASPVVP